MLKVEHKRWGQTLADLYQLSLKARHHRTRERFTALHAIASGDANATTWAKRVDRREATVRDWVHRYNRHGPQALTYRRSGGRAPLLPSAKPRPSIAWSKSKPLKIVA